MRKVIFGSLLILILIIILLLWWPSFWGRKPVSCSEIEEPVLRTLVSKKATSNEVLTWLNEAYQLKEPNVIVHKGKFMDGSTGITWERGKSRYSARFYNDSLIRIHEEWNTGWWNKLEPTGKEILDCFGPPDLYYAKYRIAQQYALSLDLWYLEKGIVVRTTHFDPNKKEPIIDEDIIMRNIHFLAPGSAEKMNRDIAPEGWAEYPVDVLKSWPGSWEAIAINNLVSE